MSACHLLAAFSCVLAVSAAAQSSEDGVSDLRVSGFGTLGVTHADAPAGWRFRRDISQPPSSGDTSASVDSRLGLQLNYAPGARFELVGQLVATRRAPSAADTSAIEWAFAAFRPTQSLTVRLGRLNVDAYLLSDYRNVGFAYPFVRPPVESYAVLPASLDGADVTQRWTDGGASWRAKAYLGRSRTGDLSTGPATEVSPIIGLVLSREADGLLLRASLTRARLTQAFAASRPLLDGLGPLTALPVPDVAAQASALRSELDLADTAVRYASLAATYEVDDWQASAEYTRIFGPTITSLSAHYLSIARRFGSLSVFGGASGVDRSGGDAQPPAWSAALTPLIGGQAALQAQALGSAATYAINAGPRQRTLSLGVRWDLHPQVALKAQWDHVRTDANGSVLWANGTADPGRANVFSTTVDFVF